MNPGVFELVNGLCSLIAALLIWKITGSFWGWAILFLPGSAFVIAGLVKLFKS